MMAKYAWLITRMVGNQHSPIEFQLKKASSFDFETPIKKRLANNILEDWAKRTPPPPGLIGLMARVRYISSKRQKACML